MGNISGPHIQNPMTVRMDGSSDPINIGNWPTGFDAIITNFPTSFNIGNLPNPLPVTGDITVGNLPSTWTVTGSVDANVTNFPSGFNILNWPSPMTVTGGVNANVTNFPSSQVVSGVVDVGNLPSSWTVTGSVSVLNFPATQPISGSVSILNFPANQTVSGTVNIGNLPATQPISGSVTVSGTVNVGNFPATQPISGTVSVGNFPATQPVSIAGTIPVSLSSLPAPYSTTLTIAQLTAAGQVSATFNADGCSRGSFIYLLNGLTALSVVAFQIEISGDGVLWVPYRIISGIVVGGVLQSVIDWNFPIKFLRCRFLSEAVTFTVTIDGTFHAVN